MLLLKDIYMLSMTSVLDFIRIDREFRYFLFNCFRKYLSLDWINFIIINDKLFPRHNKSSKHYATAGSVRDQQQSVFRVRLSGRLLHPHDRHGGHLRSDGAAAQAKSSFHRGTPWTRSISKARGQILLDQGLFHRYLDRGNGHPFVVAVHVEDFRRCRRRQVNESI